MKIQKNHLLCNKDANPNNYCFASLWYVNINSSHNSFIRSMEENSLIKRQYEEFVHRRQLDYVFSEEIRILSQDMIEEELFYCDDADDIDGEYFPPTIYKFFIEKISDHRGKLSQRKSLQYHRL